MIRSICLVFVLVSFGAIAQPEKNLTNKDKYDYMFGMSYVTSGYLFNKNYADPFQNTNTSGRLFFDRLLYDAWSIEGALAYESIALYPFKDSDTTFRFDSLSRYTFDVSSKYSLARTIRSSFFDPYFLMGGGVTLHKSFGLNANVGFGLNLWLTGNFGVQGQAMLKMPVSSNFINLAYLQSNFGIVVRFSKPEIPADDFGKRRYKISKKRKRIKINKRKKES